MSLRWSCPNFDGFAPVERVGGRLPATACDQRIDGRSAEQSAEALLDGSGKVLIDSHAAYEKRSQIDQVGRCRRGSK